MLLTVKQLADRLGICQTTTRLIIDRFGLKRVVMNRSAYYELTYPQVLEMKKFLKTRKKIKGENKC